LYNKLFYVIEQLIEINYELYFLISKNSEKILKRDKNSSTERVNCEEEEIW